MPMVKVNDINMYYESHGEGEPLLLITGNGAESTQWKAMLPAFTKKYHTVIFDNRDSGRTDKTGVRYTIETMAEDAIGLMDALGVKKAHILGTSMGGTIAQTIAHKRPEMVKGLVLVVTTMKGSPRNIYANVQAIRQVRDGLDPEALAKCSVAWSFSDEFFENPAVAGIVKSAMLTVLNQSTLDPYNRQIDAFAMFDSRAWAGKIVAPTLVIGAEDDICMPRKYSAGELAKAIPGSKLVMTPGGHATFLMAPDALVKNAMEFLASVK